MELSLVTWIYEHLHTPFLDWLMPVITALGDNGFIWIIITIVLLLIPSTRKWGVMCGLSLLFMLIIGELGLKNLFDRSRPYTLVPNVPLLIEPLTSFSFPSGHATAAFAAAWVLRWMNKKIGIAAITLAALIAFSRVYLTMHYPSDVLAGAALGILCAYLARFVTNYLYDKRGTQ